MKKVLIISYYFPPMGMGGVQRTAKFAKYLHLYDWQPYVLTVTPKLYLASDNCLLHEVEKAGVKVYRTGGETNGNSHKVVKFKNDSNRKFLSNLSQTFLIPDSKIFWKAKAVELGSRIIHEEGIDLIYATAPPYTDFLAACELKEKTGLPLVLDYRDSWIDCPNNFYPTPLHKSKHSRMETAVLQCADKVITINDRIKELIHFRYPFVKDEDVVVVPQGFDPEDFGSQISQITQITQIGSQITQTSQTSQISQISQIGSQTSQISQITQNSQITQKDNKKFRITYSGSFLNYYTPKHFLDGLKQAFDKRPELKEKIEACFVGTFPDEYREYIGKLGIENAVNIAGYVEHSLCAKYLIESDVLWMMINKTERSDLHSTGKLYEYFGAGKPILACVPEGVARKSLENYGAVIMTNPDDVNAIAEAILKFYSQNEKGEMPVPNSEIKNMYNRKLLAGSLAGEFDGVITHNLEEAKV